MNKEETKGTKETLQNILTEKELSELLGLSKDQISYLRTDKGLPFVKITDRSRVYFESDLVEFFYGCRTILNRG